jgi:hypothetical protein
MEWLKFLRPRRDPVEPGVGRVQRGPNEDPSLSDDELISQRTRWFESYTSQRNVVAPHGDGPYTWPCCGHPTLSERGGDICPGCGWEDDGQDDHDSHVVRGGPNGRVSLGAARAAFTERGGTPLPTSLRAVQRSPQGLPPRAA